MTERAEKLNELITKIPLCANGRDAVRNLVAEITRENLEVATYYRIGDRFNFIGNEYLLVVAESGMNPHVVAVNLGTGSRRGTDGTKVRSLYEITDYELTRIFHARNRSDITKIGDSTIPKKS